MGSSNGITERRILALIFQLTLFHVLTRVSTSSGYYGMDIIPDDVKLDYYSIPPPCNDELRFDSKCVVRLTNQSLSLHVKYNLSYIQLQHQAIRLLVNSSDAKQLYPVLFVVRQQLGILSWQIPLQLDSFYNYHEVERTICPVINYREAENLSENQHLDIDVSSSSPGYVSVELQVEYVRSFNLQLDQEQNVEISPSKPQYYEMVFPDDTNALIVSARSDDDICAIMSIQKIDCPVFDLDKNVQFTGIYQTMTRKAAITLRKKDYEGGRFYVVFVAKSSDYDCTNIEIIRTNFNLDARTKQLKVTVTSKITEQEYYTATIGALVIFLLFYVFSIIVALVFFIVKNRPRNNNGAMNSSPSEMIRTELAGSANEPLRPRDETSYGSMNEAAHHSRKRLSNFSEGTTSGPDSPFDDEEGDGDDSSVNEDEIDMLPDANEDKNILRTKTFLYVADLARKPSKILNRKSKFYLWHMFIIAVFYSLPVVQLVITYESVSHVTGNQDICYYNFLCTYPVGTISDFNHVYSNIGYVMLGFLFIGLVWRKDLIHKERMAMHDHYEKYYGIPRHFGLFYAMGIALMMEGILSGSYHVCPNYSNFQFDTSFMYLIASLCMLKIYQTRHPDINASAHVSFMAFAVIIFVGVVGVVYGTVYFWISFAVIHIMTCIALSAQIYYMGIWKLNLGVFKRIYLTLKQDLLSSTHCPRPMYMDRLLLLTMVNAVNWSFALYGLFTRPQNFASYLLAIFIVNLLMYVAFYIIMKIRSGEKILPLPLLYIVMSIITWTAALYFFLQRTTTWELTPAQSRVYNQRCLILNFYDVHDIWHFLSAASMFFSFMILLTLDDDLVHTSRDKIAVF